MKSSCDFCADFESARPSVVRPRPAWLSTAFAITPTVGPLSLGHVLLLPLRHVTAFGELSPREGNEVQAAADGVEAVLRGRFGATLAFEHGTSGIAYAGGCGIDHAHMHFLSAGAEWDGLPPVPKASWRRLGPSWLEELRKLSSRGMPYVYFKSFDRTRYVTVASSLPSQFVRRWVAEQLGTAGWNWKESNPIADFAEANKWMAEETPPPGFSAIGELAEATS